MGDYPEAGWTKTIDLNLKAPFFQVQAALPMLRTAASIGRPARIINIASVDGVNPPAFETYAYSASKAGLLLLNRHLAKRLAPENILVNAIAPGFFRTKMTEGVLSDDAENPLERIPLARLGDAAEIGGAAFLASRASAYMTGATLVCDGGMTC